MNELPKLEVSGAHTIRNSKIGPTHARSFFGSNPSHHSHRLAFRRRRVFPTMVTKKGAGKASTKAPAKLTREQKKAIVEKYEAREKKKSKLYWTKSKLY